MYWQLNKTVMFISISDVYIIFNTILKAQKEQSFSSLQKKVTLLFLILNLSKATLLQNFFYYSFYLKNVYYEFFNDERMFVNFLLITLMIFC